MVSIAQQDVHVGCFHETILRAQAHHICRTNLNFDSYDPRAISLPKDILIPMHARTLALSLLAVSAIGLAIQDAVDVKWAPKPASTAKYKMQLIAKGIEGPSGPAELKFTSVVSRLVKEVRTDGNIVVEEKQSDFVIMFGEQDVTSMVPITAVTSTNVYAANGEAIERKSDAPDGMNNPRLDNALVFTFPGKSVKVGETWTRTTAADTSKGLFPTETVFKYEGSEMVEKWNCHKISYTFKESGAPDNIESTGTLWIDVTDGEQVKGAYTVKNIEFGPGMRSDAEGTVTRLE